MEGRGEEGSVLLLHHDDVDGAGQRGRVDLAVPLRDRLDQRVRYETHCVDVGLGISGYHRLRYLRLSPVKVSPVITDRRSSTVPPFLKFQQEL